MSDASVAARPHNFKDLTGRVFGKLTVVGYAGRTRRGNSLWQCRCECGGGSTVETKRLTIGKSTSCGCVGRANLKIKNTSAQTIDPSGRITLNAGHVCLVDPEDLPLVSPFNWTAYKSRDGLYYAKRQSPTHVLMHVLLMGGTGIDHKNGNGLDNRRDNLRFATATQNNANKDMQKSSRNRFKGVIHPRGYRKRWGACLSVGGKRHYLGGYGTEEEAARAYDRKAREVFGEFARLNFPEAS